MGESTKHARNSARDLENRDIPWTSIANVLQQLPGLAGPAQLEPPQITEVVARAKDQQNALHHNGSSVALPLFDWHAVIATVALGGNLRHKVNLSLAIAFLRHLGRQSTEVLPEELDLIWVLVRDALMNGSIETAASRSAQGFLAIPLWNVMKNGNIDELIRLHVWLADGNRGNPEVAIHSHQPFAQSWILTGEGRDHTYEVQPADATTATHAEFQVSWSDKSSSQAGKIYHVHQNSSRAENAGKLVRATLAKSSLHSRNMTYTIPAGVFHNTEVAPDIIHATLFFFDSHRGFQPVAPILGPVQGTTHTQLRDPAGMTPALLAQVVESVRAWESSYDRGLQHAQKAEWEEALQAYRSALATCESSPGFPQAPHYKHAVLGAMGHMSRMLGRYNQANITLEDAKGVCEEQHQTAKHPGSTREMHRAIGNLGMVNYQLFLLTGDMAILDVAVSQITEGVEKSRQLKAAAKKLSNPDARTQMVAYASTQEAHGLARLSLCHAARGDIRQAVESSLESLNVALSLGDPTKTAFSRFFYGRALLLNGQPEEASRQFNPRPNICTPTIALCKEPSDEHRGYIREMIAAGADLELQDERGNSALDWAVYLGDVLTQEVIKDGLRLKLTDEQIEKCLAHSILRKGYRDIFHDRLRPLLVQADSKLGLQSLRRVYAESLAADEEKRLQFDALKFVQYTDFLRHGKIPKSTEGLTRQFATRANNSQPESANYFIFLSYRWLNGARLENFTPDDAQNTQYHRMRRAIAEFLRLHPTVDSERLGIWLDWACVDQADSEAAARGIAAMSMCLSQCDAMISLTDKGYYERAWCCVEVQMIQILRKSYNLHLWYEHVIDPGTQEERLQQGPLDKHLDISTRKLTLESDRSIVLFLEQQVRLLGSLAKDLQPAAVSALQQRTSGMGIKSRL